MITPDHKPYATERQWEYCQAVVEHGSMAGAARAIGVKRQTIQNAVKAVKAKAAKAGHSPEHDMTHTVPDGFKVKGTSTLYKDGQPVIQWVKSAIDAERQYELMQEAVRAMCETIPKQAPIPLTTLTGYDDSIMNCYVITDYHLGALSWEPETGADWDTDIAEETLIKWFEKAISCAPNSESAVLAQLSDFLHWDGFDAVTPASKHLLDADTRFPNLARTAIRVLRRVISMLLTKHQTLHIIMADANHDPVSQVWLRELFSVLYEDEPRITVDTSPSPYNAYEFGQTALFFHHGHKRKTSNISDVFAGKFREMYGRTKHAYAHTGHLHSNELKETNLMLVEQHRTLAAPDAYAARGGWLSGRDAKVITYHKEYGEVGRVTISYDMVHGL